MNTDLTPQEEKTIKFYNTKASDWVAAHSTARFWGEQLDRFHNLLPSGKVLEIGTGGGRDAKELIALGYDYVGTDISDGLLDEARKYNPNTQFLKQSVYELSFPKDTFDGFWASAVLLHIPKDRINEALGKIHNVVKPNGLGFISLKQGEDESPDDSGRFFAYYAEREFSKILSENKFEVIEYKTVPMSEKTVWLAYLVRVKK